MKTRSYSLTEGLCVGLIGYAIVVLVVAALDLGLGRPLFYTPNSFGRVLVPDPGPPGTIGAASVLAYNGVHLLVFLIIGIGVVQLAHLVELHPIAWYLAFFTCVLGFFVAELTFTVIDPAGQALAWWAVLGATAAAAFGMGAFINYRHPRLWQRVEGVEE